MDNNKEDVWMVTPLLERTGKSIPYVEINTLCDLSSWNIGPGIAEIGSGPEWAGVDPSQGVPVQSVSNHSRNSSMQILLHPPVTPCPSLATMMMQSLFNKSENVGSTSLAANPIPSLGAPFTCEFHG